MNGCTYTGGAVQDPWFKAAMSLNNVHSAYAEERFETWWAAYNANGTLTCFEDD